MATGTGTYKGLAVPLFGESNIVGQTAADDTLTITGPAAHSGSLLVLENSDGTDQFTVSAAGAVVATGTVRGTAGLITLDNGTAPALADMPAVNGALIAGFSTSAQLYLRQGGTLYYFGAIGTLA